MAKQFSNVNRHAATTSSVGNRGTQPTPVLSYFAPRSAAEYPFVDYCFTENPVFATYNEGETAGFRAVVAVPTDDYTLKYGNDTIVCENPSMIDDNYIEEQLGFLPEFGREPYIVWLNENKGKFYMYFVIEEDAEYHATCQLLDGDGNVVETATVHHPESICIDIEL